MIDKIRELDINQKVLLLLAFSAIALIVLFVVLMRPLLASLREMPEKQQAAKQEYSFSLLEINHLKSIKKESAKTLVELTQMDQMMPNSKDLPALIVDVQEIADNAGVEFVSITPGEMLPHDKYIEIPIDLSLSSQFFEFVDFLYQLEKMSRKVKVNTVLIGEGAPHLPQIISTVRCSAFIFDRESKEPASNLPPGAPPQGAGTSGK